MYKEYRDSPVSNKICMNACRENAYKKHIEKLQRIKATINTSKPDVPKTIGQNKKRAENEKQRSEAIVQDNKLLAHNLNTIQNRKGESIKSPQVRFTLHGSYQTEQMRRIDRENRKLVDALLHQKPNISRHDFYVHNCEHIYQLNKMSTYKKTIPINKIFKDRLPPIQEPNSTRTQKSQKDTQQSNQPKSARVDLFITSEENAFNLIGEQRQPNQNEQQNEQENEQNEQNEQENDKTANKEEDSFQEPSNSNDEENNN